MNADARRQAAYAAWAQGEERSLVDRLAQAVKAATTVEISDEMIEAFGEAWRAANREQWEQGTAPDDGPPGAKRRAGIAAALRVAGFEVIP